MDTVTIEFERTYGEAGSVIVDKSARVLTLAENEIERIDLSPLAELHELKRLSLYRNKITEIDLSPLAACPI